jgi:hypothetical protein
MEWTNMIKALNNYNRNTNLMTYWENGAIIKGVVDTISETCTCEIDEDDPNYLEYYLCAFEVAQIISPPSKDIRNPYFGELRIGSLIEVSELNEPIRIEAEGKGVIWQK